MGKYLADWEQSKKKGIIEDFRLTDELDGCKIVLAAYQYADYSGDAFVIFNKNGILYEVHGSHCSCCGLEGQWQPEETSKEALLYRSEQGYGLIHDLKKEVKKALGAY